MKSSGDEYIYKISLAVTAGVGAGAAAMPPGAAGGALCAQAGVAAPYAAAGLLAAVLAALLPLLTGHSIRKSGSPLPGSGIFWTAVFFLLGMFCYFNAAVIYPTVNERRYFAKASDALTVAIEDIPFKDEGSNALVLALLKGDRSHLDRKTTADFRNAGAAHLLALSGMHLGIIYLLLGRLLSVLGNTPAVRKSRQALTVLLTLSYTLMCGAGASLVRAWLFILLDSLARILDRPQPPGQIFCTALLLHLVARPECICEIGFQLSYLAMAGIVFIWPRVRTWMESRIWDALSLSISCQLFTAPLTLLYFGTFPKYFLVTNLIAAPLTSLVMTGGIVATAASAASLQCPVLYLICEKPVTLLCTLLGNIASL
ncbi:MAG: ComEC/Rec2 family competence protein [Bacteroidales bacterium]|nr:ComEC/Rec2 family competence protein [Bacteroidales bacterium]